MTFTNKCQTFLFLTSSILLIGCSDPVEDDNPTDSNIPGDVPLTCEEAASTNNSYGCRFYAVDMDRFDAVADHEPFSIAIANPNSKEIATITIEYKVGDSWEEVISSFEIASKDSKVVELPDLHLESSQLATGYAYRISSDVPVATYQFSSFIYNNNASSDDASMLYPALSLDTLYNVVGWGYGAVNSTPSTTIVATKDGTAVTITPSVPTIAGDGVPAGQINTPFEVIMNDGDALQLASDPNTPLTGTIIESNAPIAVFTGHECATIPSNVFYCNQIGEQQSGVHQWGTHFVASRMPIRNEQSIESTLWQIYAIENHTTISWIANTDVTGLPEDPIQLQRGEEVQLFVAGTTENAGDFEIVSDRPIGVMSYMTSAHESQTELGDPAMAQLPSIEQFLPHYVVVIPSNWLEDVGVFTRLAGEVITDNGEVIPESAWVSVGEGNYEVARIPLTEGMHEFEGDGTPFGLMVAGYDDSSSYAYTGGSGTINP